MLDRYYQTQGDQELTFFADEYPDVFRGWSFKKLASGHTQCVEIVRLSDNATQVFGFESSEPYARLDVSAVESWLGASDGGVISLYSYNNSDELIGGLANGLIIAKSGIVNVDANGDVYMLKELGDVNWIREGNLTNNVTPVTMFCVLDHIEGGVNFGTSSGVRMNGDVTPIQIRSTDVTVLPLSEIPAIDSTGKNSVYYRMLSGSHEVGDESTFDNKTLTTPYPAESAGDLYVGRFRTNNVGMEDSAWRCYGIFYFDSDKNSQKNNILNRLNSVYNC